MLDKPTEPSPEQTHSFTHVVSEWLLNDSVELSYTL